MTDETTPSIPAGWFDDAQDPTRIRYWDGARWTEHRAPKVATPSTATAANPASTASSLSAADWPVNRLIAGIGAVLVVIGSLMPWATLNIGFGSISVNGTDGDGVITLIGGLIVVVLVLLRKYLAAGIVGALTTAVLVYDVLNISTAVDADTEFVTVSVGWGLIVATIAGIASVVGSFLQMRDERASKPMAPVSSLGG